MNKILLILFLLILCTPGIFSLGRKDTQKPDENDWAAVKESTLFGLVEKTADNNVAIIVNPDGTERVVYIPVGDLVKDIRKETGKYICIYGRIKKNQAQGDNKVLVTQVLLVQEIPAPDWNNAKEIILEGKIELGMDNMVCIVTNWETRSRVSHYVYGPTVNDLKKSLGHIVKVTGIEDTSPVDETPYVKEIIVVTIISLADN